MKIVTKLTVLLFVLILSNISKISAQTNVGNSKSFSIESAPGYHSSENAKNPGTIINTCPPPNNLPCGAVLVPLGGTALGSNTCADSINEPYNSAQCVFGGEIRTVWYKAIVPLSGMVRVRTHPLTLVNTQIEGFIFANGCNNAAGTYTSQGCNDNGVSCVGGFSDFSEYLFSGLTFGDTLFVAVDGISSITGTFEISFIDGSGTVFPPVYQQDCAGAQVVCSTSDIVVANPGFRNTGNICDLPSGIGCWGIGERNSAWYQFTVDPALSGGTATISFDLFSLPTTDIDFLMWDVTGLPDACQSIQSLALNIQTPAGCNFYPEAPATGLSPTGTGGPQSPYSPSVVFTGAPRTYLMLLNDYNSAGNAGFTLHWGTTPITTASTATWTGLSDNLYTTTTNWGDCVSTVTCSVDAAINSTANGLQPNILAGSVKSVRNIIINVGATLTLQAGATLQVCGNFTNFGTLICNTGSTIEFIGTGLQTISGLLTGASSFANLVITKPGGSVQLLTNIDVTENFTVTNGASIFNINGKYMKVGGNFSNAGGTTTFTGIGGSTVEFYKSNNKNFTNSNGSIRLNHVVMNRPGGRVSLTGLNSNMNIDSTLKLTSGIITTRSLPALEVNMKYYLPAAITQQNPTSYIDGLLRRKISNNGSSVLGSYDFPLGDLLSQGGYELANINFTTPATVFDLLATFTPWPAATPPAQGPAASECTSATYAMFPIFDNGYWTFKRSTSNFDGNYNISMHNKGQSNNLGSVWTVAKADILSDPTSISSWGLLGNCVLTSTPANTQRFNINPLPAHDTTSFNHYYATVQTGVILPIELLYFSAEPKGEDVLCKWETASETNNEYFDVERSINGIEYESIGRVRGFGQGISTETRKYSLIDNDLCDDIRYYKLKQIDINGLYSYSDIVAVNCSRNKELINVYPNPAKSTIICTFYEIKNGSVKFQWHDLLGKIIKEEIHDVVKGYNTVQLDVSDLAKGIYFLRIKETGKTFDENDRQIKFLMN